MLKAKRLAHYKEAIKTIPPSVKSLTDPAGTPNVSLLAERRLFQYTLPKLITHDQEFKVGMDMFGSSLQQALQLEMNDNSDLFSTAPTPKIDHFLVDFDSKLSNGAFGQYLSSLKTIRQPRVVINGDGYYTLMMVDLDYPNQELGHYHEWCHWLVTDIEVKGSVELPSVLSKFITGEPSDLNGDADSAEAKVASENAVSAKETSAIGNGVFDYVPPHPPLSNPKKTHRYAITLLKQPSKLSLDPLSFKTKLLQNIPKQSPLSATARQLLKSELKDSPIEADTRKYFNTLLVSQVFDFKPVFTQFFTQVYSTETTEVYQRLGIHEAVYGKLTSGILRKVDRGVERLLEGHVTVLDSVHQKFKLPTRLQLKANDLRKSRKVKEVENGEDGKKPEFLERIVKVRVEENINVYREPKKFFYKNA